MRTTALPCLLAGCLLTACAAGPQPMPDLEATTPVKVPPQASLLTPPPRLPPPRSGQLQDLESNHREVARRYHQVASQLCELLIYLQGPTEGCPIDQPNPKRKSRDDE